MTEEVTYEKPNKFIGLADGFYVAPQLEDADIELAKNLGIKLIISNRPDHEEVGQPLNADLEKRAHTAGIRFVHIPVDSRGIGRHHMDDFKEALKDEKGPVLAFCRSGTRSTTLRAFVRASEGDVISDIVRQASDAGYELYTIVPRLEAVVPEKRRSK